MSFRKLCVELKFSGSRYVLGPTSFLWHVQRFASAIYGGHLSGPKWLPLKACPHVRTRSTHPTKAERERERNCVSVCEGTMGWEIRLEERESAWTDDDFWLPLNNLTIRNLYPPWKQFRMLSQEWWQSSSVTLLATSEESYYRHFYIRFLSTPFDRLINVYESLCWPTLCDTDIIDVNNFRLSTACNTATTSKVAVTFSRLCCVHIVLCCVVIVFQ